MKEHVMQLDIVRSARTNGVGNIWNRFVNIALRPEVALVGGIQLLVWGFCIALTGVRAAGVVELATYDPLWLARSPLSRYWVGLGLALFGLLLTSRLQPAWRAIGVVIVAVIARGLPTLVSGLPYGRDAFMHWGSVQLVANSGQVDLNAPAHTYLSLPLLFSWGGLVARLVGIQSVEEALPLLVGWQLFVPALTALLGLMVCMKLTPHPLLQIGGAIAIVAGTPFIFPSHFSPLSIAAPLLWGLFWLGMLPKTPGRVFVQIGAMLALVVLHPLLPLLYLCFALLMQAAGRWRASDDRLALYSPLLSGLACYVTWQVYIAAHYSLPMGLNTIQTLIRTVLTLSVFESAQQNFAAPTPAVVSIIRWSLFAGFSLLAGASIVLDFMRNRRLSIYVGCFATSISTALLAGFAGKYGEFASRALPFVVPFAVLVVLSSTPAKYLRALTATMVLLAVPLSIIAVHFDMPSRLTLPADIRGLQYASNAVRQDDAVLADADLRGFRDESVGQYFYDDMDKYRVQRVANAQLVVVQAATQARLQYSSSYRAYQESLNFLAASASRMYDNGRVVVYRR